MRLLRLPHPVIPPFLPPPRLFLLRRASFTKTSIHLYIQHAAHSTQHTALLSIALVRKHNHSQIQAMSRLLPPRFLLPARRLFSTSVPRTRPAFATGPSPPRLPPKEQEEYERLQKASTGAFSTPRTPTPAASSSAPTRPQINQSPQSASTESSASEPELKAQVEAKGKGSELHPDVRRGAKPEFEGEINPKTGEVGGPKNEPLRWGSTGERGDWSYNGRVTDF